MSTAAEYYNRIYKPKLNEMLKDEYKKNIKEVDYKIISKADPTNFIEVIQTLSSDYGILLHLDIKSETLYILCEELVKHIENQLVTITTVRNWFTSDWIPKAMITSFDTTSTQMGMPLEHIPILYCILRVNGIHIKKLYKFSLYYSIIKQIYNSTVVKCKDICRDLTFQYLETIDLVDDEEADDAADDATSRVEPTEIRPPRARDDDKKVTFKNATVNVNFLNRQSNCIFCIWRNKDTTWTDNKVEFRMMGGFASNPAYRMLSQARDKIVMLYELNKPTATKLKSLITSHFVKKAINKSGFIERKRSPEIYLPRGIDNGSHCSTLYFTTRNNFKYLIDFAKFFEEQYHKYISDETFMNDFHKEYLNQVRSRLS